MTDQSPCTVVEAVRQDLLDRSRVGQSKYGTTLGNAGLSQRETLQHAYEEALDLANYLKTEIMRLGEAPKGVFLPIVGTLYGRPVTEGDIISASQYADVQWGKRPYILTEQKPSEQLDAFDRNAENKRMGQEAWKDVLEATEPRYYNSDHQRVPAPSEPVACEDAPIDIQSGQEMGWTKVGNMGWRKGKVTINIQWQPFNRKDMILVNDGVTTYYALDLDDAFKMGERLL